MSLHLAIGVGCRRGCPAEALVAVVREACSGLDMTRAGLFTIEAKRGEAGLRDAAATLGLPLAFVSTAGLGAVVGGLTHYSARVEAATGVPSVAEAAALAGAGPGGRILVPRLVHAAATCAVAVRPEADG